VRLHDRYVEVSAEQGPVLCVVYDALDVRCGCCGAQRHLELMAQAVRPLRVCWRIQEMGDGGCGT
jgi:hypothetical protein